MAYEKTWYDKEPPAIDLIAELEERIAIEEYYRRIFNELGINKIYIRRKKKWDGVRQSAEHSEPSEV